MLCIMKLKKQIILITLIFSLSCSATSIDSNQNSLDPNSEMYKLVETNNSTRINLNERYNTIKKRNDQIIGFAINDIKPGEHVHSHNLEFREFKRNFKVTNKKNIINEKADTFFNGILRDNGGETWSDFNTGLNHLGVFTLELNPESRILYAGTRGGGVYWINLDRDRKSVV